MKEKGKGKSGLMAPMGSAHWQKDMGQLSVADGKYAGEMSNPEDLKRSNDALASYVKKNRMSY